MIKECVIFADDDSSNFEGVEVKHLIPIKIFSVNNNTLFIEDYSVIWDYYVYKINLWNEMKQIINHYTKIKNKQILKIIKQRIILDFGSKANVADNVDIHSGITQKQLLFITDKINNTDTSHVFIDWDKTMTKVAGFIENWNKLIKVYSAKINNFVSEKTAVHIIAEIFSVYYFGGKDRFLLIKEWWNNTYNKTNLYILTSNICHNAIFNFMKDIGFTIYKENVIFSNTKLQSINHVLHT